MLRFLLWAWLMAWGSSPVAHTLAQSTNQSAITTSAINTSGADTLFAVISNYLGFGGSSTISDSKGNTWAALTNRTNGGNLNSRMFYAKNAIVGSGHTFTASSSGGDAFPGVAVSAWSGGHLSAPFDVQAGTSGTSAVTSLQPGSITPANAGELIISGISFQDAFSGGLSINSSFTITDSADRISTGLPVGMAYLVQGAAAAVNPTWSWNSGSINGEVASQAAFIAATGGATRGLFYPPNLSGLGSGGSFFQGAL